MLVLGSFQRLCCIIHTLAVQHRELSISICRTIENNEEAGIRPSKTYQSFVVAAGVYFWVYSTDLYEDHHIWVPIYLDHHFWAGMRSTQRSEIMHSFFNKFITRNISLIQFVKQYDNCLRSREQAERESDAADFYMFQDVYTHQKFRKVQAQIRGKANCITRLTNSALGYSVYEVGEQVSSSIFNRFVVTYDSVAAEVKRRHTHIKRSHDEPLLEQRSKRFEELVFRSQNIYEFASESDEFTAILHCAYDKVMVEMEELKDKRKGTCLLSHEDAKLESVNELQSPPRIRTRGRPKNRLGSKLDKQIANASKKKKTKDLNELNLFYAASVVHPNSSQYQEHVMNYHFREPVAVDRVFTLCPSCVSAPSCVAASSWLELVKPRLNDGIEPCLGMYDVVRAIIISAAASSSGVGLLRDEI
ncbi:hypothetical protein Ahy_A05g023689 [Arachis hypogaea]|uniref:Protein FAR1-RELATED SEQUENCE n=1 Tax=Arachis hypogaea TaxID=3818 RepID=A0A445D480_ARAHY|nr:hypothetical protein Ahy_A05g023689 [Arachis hypogaea]